MKKDRSTQAAASDVNVFSIGACVTAPQGKKGRPYVAVAYMLEGQSVYFTFMDVPARNKSYTTQDFLRAICAAEATNHVSYCTTGGLPKTICLCRSGTGRELDIAARDHEKDLFEESFTEIVASQVRFAPENEADVVCQIGKRVSIPITSSFVGSVDPTSLTYAVLNAYNACLLGKAFESEELQLETRAGRRIRIEMKRRIPEVWQEEILYVCPVFKETQDRADYYITEEFNYIDAENASCRAYKILYRSHARGYILERI